MVITSTILIEDPDQALPGRDEPMEGLSERHAVLNAPLKGPFPSDCFTIYFGMGCFWGAERAFWKLDGVYSTSVGYQGGHTPHPVYDEVCSG